MAFTPAASFAMLAAIPAVLFASQTASRSATAVPEPSDLLLFSMGVIGLIVGRCAAMRRKDDDKNE